MAVRLQPRPSRRAAAAELAPSTARGAAPTTATAAAFARVSRRSASASAAATGSASPERPSTAAEVTAASTGGVPATHSPATGGSQPLPGRAIDPRQDAAAACGGAIARSRAGRARGTRPARAAPTCWAPKRAGTRDPPPAPRAWPGRRSAATRRPGPTGGVTGPPPATRPSPSMARRRTARRRTMTAGCDDTARDAPESTEGAPASRGDAPDSSDGAPASRGDAPDSSDGAPASRGDAPEFRRERATIARRRAGSAGATTAAGDGARSVSGGANPPDVTLGCGGSESRGGALGPRAAAPRGEASDGVLQSVVAADCEGGGAMNHPRARSARSWPAFAWASRRGRRRGPDREGEAWFTRTRTVRPEHGDGRALARGLAEGVPSCIARVGRAALKEDERARLGGLARLLAGGVRGDHGHRDKRDEPDEREQAEELDDACPREPVIRSSAAGSAMWRPPARAGPWGSPVGTRTDTRTLALAPRRAGCARGPTADARAPPRLDRPRVNAPARPPATRPVPPRAPARPAAPGRRSREPPRSPGEARRARPTPGPEPTGRDRRETVVGRSDPDVRSSADAGRNAACAQRRGREAGRGREEKPGCAQRRGSRAGADAETRVRPAARTRGRTRTRGEARVRAAARMPGGTGRGEKRGWTQRRGREAGRGRGEKRACGERRGRDARRGRGEKRACGERRGRDAGRGRAEKLGRARRGDRRTKRAAGWRRRKRWDRIGGGGRGHGPKRRRGR